MIRVSIERARDDMICCLTVRGHAMTPRVQTSAHQFDLVCAAVSAVAQTAVIGLEEHLGLQPEVDIRDGFLSCKLPGDWDRQMQARANDIMAAAWYGLQAISMQFPEHVCLSEEQE